jgi:hypothetical protein
MASCVCVCVAPLDREVPSVPRVPIVPRDLETVLVRLEVRLEGLFPGWLKAKLGVLTCVVR